MQQCVLPWHGRFEYSLTFGISHRRLIPIRHMPRTAPGYANRDPSAICPRSRFAADERPLLEKLYAQMALIREFEARALALFEAGELFGTTHCYIGQEANAVGVINHLRAGDIIFSNHRCHGHFLTYADRADLLMAELMGREAGVVGGRGGSQHICHGNFYSNGIQGGIVPTAAGMAMAEKMKGTNNIAVVFIGDGTLGQGIVYETLNMASLWEIPILIVVENNRWAQSTPIEKELAGDIVSRADAFNISAHAIDSTDAERLYRHFEPIVDKVRDEGQPHFEVIETYRLCHHSKSDDHRPEAEVESHEANDPLRILGPRINEWARLALEDDAIAEIDRIVDWANEMPFPDPDKALINSTSQALQTQVRLTG